MRTLVELAVYLQEHDPEALLTVDHHGGETDLIPAHFHLARTFPGVRGMSLFAFNGSLLPCIVEHDLGEGVSYIQGTGETIAELRGLANLLEWLDAGSLWRAVPTPAQVLAHQEAHPIRWTIMDGCLWLCYREGVMPEIKMLWVDKHGTVRSPHGMPPNNVPSLWRPTTTLGMPVSWPSSS